MFFNTFPNKIINIFLPNSHFGTGKELHSASHVVRTCELDLCSASRYILPQMDTRLLRLKVSSRDRRLGIVAMFVNVKSGIKYRVTEHEGKFRVEEMPIDSNRFRLWYAADSYFDAFEALDVSDES